MTQEKGNMIFAAILIALLIWLVSAIVSESLVAPKHLKESVYKIEVPEGASNMEEIASAKEEVEPIDGLIAGADVEMGRKLTKQCVQCHTLEKGGAHKIGPNLWGIVDASIAAQSGFAYSSGAKGLEGKKWSVENLNHFLYKPRKFMPGTKMSYAGLKKAKDRANLVAYLLTLTT